MAAELVLTHTLPPPSGFAEAPQSLELYSICIDAAVHQIHMTHFSLKFHLKFPTIEKCLSTNREMPLN